jgi:hypothetical protein
VNKNKKKKKLPEIEKKKKIYRVVVFSKFKRVRVTKRGEQVSQVSFLSSLGAGIQKHEAMLCLDVDGLSMPGVDKTLLVAGRAGLHDKCVFAASGGHRSSKVKGSAVGSRLRESENEKKKKKKRKKEEVFT